MKCQPGWCSVVNTGITTCILVGTESEIQFFQLLIFMISIMSTYCVIAFLIAVIDV